MIPIVRTNERNASDADYDSLPTTVTFDSGRDRASRFTFTPVDDAIDDDGERVRLALGAVLPRLVSGGATTAATVSITDNDTRGVTVRPPSLRINEGATGEYTVVLGSEPTGDVTVTIDAPTNTDITVDRASLTFTSSNWSSPQRVEASGSEDTDDADDTGTITHAVSGGDYASVGADCGLGHGARRRGPAGQGGIRSGARHRRAEGGNGISFTVRLSKDPERTITIPIRVAHHDGASSADYTLSVDGVAATSVTFDSRRRTVEADHADRGRRRDRRRR